MFQKKKILFISPNFFNYEIEIINKLQKFGASVDFFDDRPSNNGLAKAFFRIKNPFKFIWINFYYKQILKNIKHKKYDYFLLVKGEVTPKFFLSQLRKIQKKTRFVYYTFDSILNNQNPLKYLDLFDSKFSFDLDDIKNYLSFKFLPLFYLDEYAKLENNKKNIDVLFIGTVHSDRYLVVKKIISSLQNQSEKKLNFQYYFYLQNIFHYYFHKITNKNFSDITINEVSFNSLSTKQILNLVSKSKCIIDIQHPNQTGLTMRVIECLGAEKKIITTNNSIKKYDFYNDNNICFVDRSSPTIPLSFISNPYVKIRPEIIEKYSIGNWLLELFRH